MKIQPRLIEIELHSKCNRKCSWCPNSYIDRTFYKEMEEHIFTEIIDQLAYMDYSGYISFSRYNEPFLNKELLKARIQYIRERLPNVTLVTNTNGDFDYSDVDLDELTVMDYDNVKEEVITPNFRIMKLTNVNNRAGALPNIKGQERTAPCFEPIHFVGIDYEGSVVPCCNIRHDIPAHKDYILGNLHDNTLIEILNSEKAAQFRIDVSNGIFPDICKTCTKGPGRYTSDTPSIGGKQT